MNDREKVLQIGLTTSENYQGVEEAPDTPKKPKNTKRLWFLYALGAAVVITITVPLILYLIVDTNKGDVPRNVIIMIPDGTGPASWTAARQLLKTLGITNEDRLRSLGENFLDAATNASLFKENGLFFENFLLGTAQTYSTDALVTDSAAAATAYACCKKTNNGAIAVDSDGFPLGTLFEAAKLKNMVTGFVVTSTVTHATPASFSSHLASRNDEQNIAIQQAYQQSLDFALGGGRQFYNSTLQNALKDRQYKVLLNGNDWNTYKTSPTLPVFGLFANGQLSYEIDRWMTDQPSLSEMVSVILKQLDTRSIVGKGGRGFIMMIEGSRVDHAGHANDPATHMRDLIEFDNAAALALEFASRHPNTLVVSLADHETGGMSLGIDNVYQWYPERLLSLNMSAEAISPYLAGLTGDELNNTYHQYTQFWLTAEQEAAIVAQTSDYYRAIAIAQAISKNVGIGWATTGHSGVDVNVYGYGPHDYVSQLHHVIENIHACDVVRNFLGLDLDSVTEELRKVSSPFQQVQELAYDRHW